MKHALLISLLTFSVAALAAEPWQSVRILPLGTPIDAGACAFKATLSYRSYFGGANLPKKYAMGALDVGANTVVWTVDTTGIGTAYLCDYSQWQPPAVAVSPQVTTATSSGQSEAAVREQIRQQCIQRQVMQHGLGGPTPNFALC